MVWSATAAGFSASACSQLNLVADAVYACACRPLIRTQGNAVAWFALCTLTAAGAFLLCNTLTNAHPRTPKLPVLTLSLAKHAAHRHLGVRFGGIDWEGPGKVVYVLI